MTQSKHVLRSTHTNVYFITATVLIVAQIFRTTGIVAVIAGYARVPLLGLPVPHDFLRLLPPFFDYTLSLAVFPVAIEFYKKTSTGWKLALAFGVIGLLDAIQGVILGVIGFDIFLLPASIWVVANIALLVILYQPKVRAASHHRQHGTL